MVFSIAVLVYVALLYQKDVYRYVISTIKIYDVNYHCFLHCCKKCIHTYGILKKEVINNYPKLQEFKQII